tara:strand:+ start:25376 stop:26368 length:993 start_codon:yes stop_codon:yes gene_type:complete
MRRNSIASRVTGPDLTSKAALLAVGLLASVLAPPVTAQVFPTGTPPQVQPAAPSSVPLPEPAQVEPKPHGEGRYQGSYSESTSRELFRACDGNSDDRLDVFEAADCFDVLPSPRDLEGFARIDTDRDGFVTWPEFDQRFRRGLENGGTFTVRTVRPFVMPEPPPQPLTPLQKFIRLYDKDGDGGLSQTEIIDLLKATGLPEIVATVLMQSDLDKSGKVEEAELAPWHARLPKPADTGKSEQKAGLTQPWLDADGNLDEAIDATELTLLLRRLDPGLLRWTKNLLAALDTDKDGKLSVKELQQAKLVDAPSPDVTKPAVPAGTKPVQAPQR